MPVPKERSFLQQLNTIKSLVESTCHDKWDILIETAFPAAGEALLLLLIPSPEEILENFLHPNTRRTGGKRRGNTKGRRQMTRYGQLRWWQKISFPDIDNIIADALPGREVHAGRDAGNKERWLWMGIDVVDRVLWYWLLVEVGKTFVYEWSTGIVESRFCTSSFTGIITGNALQPTTGSSAHFWALANQFEPGTNVGWTVLNQGAIQRENETIPMGGQIVCTIDGKAREDEDPLETIWQIRITTDNDGGDVTVFFGAQFKVKAGDTFSQSISIEHEPFTRVSFIMQRVGGDFLTAENLQSTIAVFATTQG